MDSSYFHVREMPLSLKAGALRRATWRAQRATCRARVAQSRAKTALRVLCKCCSHSNLRRSAVSLDAAGCPRFEREIHFFKIVDGALPPNGSALARHVARRAAPDQRDSNISKWQAMWVSLGSEPPGRATWRVGHLTWSVGVPDFRERGTSRTSK